MADICVIYLSDDQKVVERLVTLLRQRWQVWWAHEIPMGSWEDAVRREIDACQTVIAVINSTFVSDRRGILADEMRYAQGQNKLLPFFIGRATLPFGFGELARTEAFSWRGDSRDSGFRSLIQKLQATVQSIEHDVPARLKEISLGSKQLPLPAFAFSVSSHETRISPRNGLTLLGALEPEVVLASAYDASTRGNVVAFASAYRRIRTGSSVVMLDSGNYEASRKDDYRSRTNANGWSRDKQLTMTARLAPDLAFAFDEVNPKGSPNQIADRIIRAFERDVRRLSQREFPLCPIVHLANTSRIAIADRAATTVKRVADALDPFMIAIPERELGDGLRHKTLSVKAIRNALDSLGKYYPLHLLGTGNPISMLAFAAAGADSFDGLEWCRTVADYTDGHLFHFQQFDLVADSCLSRIRNPAVRSLVESSVTPYATRVLSYNIDFFADWARSMRQLIHAGQSETLLKMIPGVGPAIFQDLQS